MSQSEKKAYYYAIKDRYLKANKREKSIILNEFCTVCRYNKRYAIRLLNKVEPRFRTKKIPGRKPKYLSDSFIKVLKIIWEATDYICSKRLKAAIPFWMPNYEKTYGILDENVKDQLLRISPATLDRVLKTAGIHSKKGLHGTKPGTILKNQIPIRTDNWDISRPGFMESDTVAHCGNSMSGDFIWSLTMTDIHTGWTENRAIWNKASKDVVAQV